MSARSVFAEKRSMYELIPVIENWLIENEYTVTAIANRIDAEGKGIAARIFFENYSSGCLVKVISNEQFFMVLKAFLSNQQLLSYRVSCSYCGRTFESSKSSCPYCGASKENIEKRWNENLHFSKTLPHYNAENLKLNRKNYLEHGEVNKTWRLIIAFVKIWNHCNSPFINYLSTAFSFFFTWQLYTYLKYRDVDLIAGVKVKISYTSQATVSHPSTIGRGKTASWSIGLSDNSRRVTVFCFRRSGPR